MSLALRRLDSSEPGFAEALTRLLAYADDVDAEVDDVRFVGVNTLDSVEEMERFAGTLLEAPLQ